MPEQRPQSHGLIRLFVRHPTASNLLMAALILAGLFSAWRLNTQFFPTINVPVITVSVVWPGASAEDVEKNILDALEPELRFLDDVDEATSIAREGVGTISLEFYSNADMQKAQSDVEQAVAQVTTLPEDSEEPVVRRAVFYEPVARIAVTGPFSEQVIKGWAKQLRDRLLAAGIDRVTFVGLRDEEIWVRVRERELRRLELSLDRVAARIRDETRDLPSGTLEGEAEVQLRARAERKTPEALQKIEIKALPEGGKVFLKDIAKVETRFDRDGVQGLFRGRTAIELDVWRALSADTLKTMEVLETTIARLRPTLPPTLTVEVYDVKGKFVVQRLGILIKNGLTGLVLVLIILFVFLNARIAFWVAAGIPVAFLATLAVMLVSGQSINMVSMFALIMMLGIIVDDAIVVGEHTATRQALGDTRLEAAERGASRMLRPVLAATLTTQAAFFPIFLVRKQIGDVMEAIPLVVTAVLIASLIECFLILPGHLRHGFGKIKREPGRFRAWFDGRLDAFRDGPFLRFVGLAYRWRYTTVAFTFAALAFSIGLVAGGRIGFHFFPSPEPENISAHVVFAAGMPREAQKAAMLRIEGALYDAEKALLADGEPARKAAQSRASGDGEAGGPAEAKDDWRRALEHAARRIVPSGLAWGAREGAAEPRLVVAAFIALGESGRSRGDNLGQIQVQLTASEERSIPTKRILAAWRAHMPKIPGVERVAVVGRRGGPPGRDVDVRLLDAPIEVLKRASDDLKTALAAIPGVTAIADDLPYGKPELILELTPRGTALGFTSQSIGAQLRNAFEGAIATRFARGDEEITVRVLREQEFGGINDLRQLYLLTPAGTRVPLPEVVTVSEKRGFAVIQRRDGVRTVAVTADLDYEVTSTPEVLEELERTVMPRITRTHGVHYAFKGRAEERAESFADLGSGGILALALIYIILAWVFESYAKPIAVMAIIPFGIVGAILGHLAMGQELTIISLIGLLGLSGILVNDSIILVSQVQKRLEAGNSLAEAAIGASRDRLRAVLLTSLTTIGGLLPLMFETSRQAQFLIPMAVTLVFGLAAATALVLVLVPALMGVGADIARLARALARWLANGRAAGTPGAAARGGAE